MTQPKTFHFNVQALTDFEFEERLELAKKMVPGVSKLAMFVDLFWTALTAPASEFNDQRQDRLEAACLRSGIDPMIPLRICHFGSEVKKVEAQGMN